MAKMKAGMKKRHSFKSGGNPSKPLRVKKKSSSGQLVFGLPGLTMNKLKKMGGKIIFGEYLKKQLQKNKDIKYFK